MCLAGIKLNDSHENDFFSFDNEVVDVRQIFVGESREFLDRNDDCNVIISTALEIGIGSNLKKFI